MSDTLTPKQLRFVDEYLLDLNATQAALRAGYSRKTANEQGSRMLANVSIAAAIRVAQADRADRTKITQDRVIEELAAIAFADPGDLFDEPTMVNGTRLLPLAEWPETARRAVAAVKTKHYPTGMGAGHEQAGIGEVTEVRFWSKPQALKLLAQHLGMLSAEGNVGEPPEEEPQFPICFGASE